MRPRLMHLPPVHRPRRAGVAVAAALLAALPAGAQRVVTPADSAALAQLRAVPLRNGPNAVDLTGRPGDVGQVLVARRENLSAHGYSAIAFAVRTRAATAGGARWQLVTVEVPDTTRGRRTREDQALTTVEGADCTLADVRLLRPRRGPATLVVAERDFGASFADSARVRFTVYRLRHFDDERRDAFEPERALTARRRYCDVNAAFARELGLPASAGVVHDVP